MTAEKLIGLYDEEENLSRRLITIRRLIQTEEQIFMETLFLKIIGEKAP